LESMETRRKRGTKAKRRKLPFPHTERERNTHTHRALSSRLLLSAPLGLAWVYLAITAAANLENKLYESTTRKHNRSCPILLRILPLLRVQREDRFRVWCSGFLYWRFPSYWDFVLSLFSPSCRDKEDSRRALLTRQSLELRREDAELSCITSYSV
jgi:hypothetical protein